jgi:hypothetical protein
MNTWPEELTPNTPRELPVESSDTLSPAPSASSGSIRPGLVARDVPTGDKFVAFSKMEKGPRVVADTPGWAATLLNRGGSLIFTIDTVTVAWAEREGEALSCT